MSLTHDPAADGFPQLVGEQPPDPLSAAATSPQPEVEERGWAELLREGLTFDLIGLAPGDPAGLPLIEHRFDLERAPSDFQHEVLALTAGQHIAGGQRSLPVVRGLVALARDLVHLFDDLEAVVWPPSQSAIGRRFFESVVTAWLEGGPFPGLGLTAFQVTMDGALQSTGLNFWIGQELRLERPLADDKVTATRLGVRLVNHFVLSGALRKDDRIQAPDGRNLTLKPSENGKFIRVWQA